jgi:DNA-binding NarL/FixJ family response regulator
MPERLENALLSPPPPTNGEGKRILIADDSELVRKITRRFLETAGFMVCAEAMDGGDAVEKATELKPDLIVLDLAMPDMNGVEAASLLKGRMPNVPIIMFSMHSDCLGQGLVSALGVKAVISKVDGLDKLIDCVRGVLHPRA